jgi:CDP-diacylglycerol--glycerol-3-phosphate 3-phosphatidyltransferase
VKLSLDGARKAARGRPALMSLPNLVTLARIAAAPVIVALLYAPGVVARIAALVLFIVASLSDYVDGWLARRAHAGSRFGAMLDPIADKILVAAVFVMLVADSTIAGLHVVAVLLILTREILVSGLREFLAGRNVTVPVTLFAKWKTTLQLTAAGFLIGAGLGVGAWVDVTGLVLLWLSAAITVSTGLDYLRASAGHFRS